MLKSPNHKCRINTIQDSITWWIFWLCHGNNTKRIWDKRPTISVSTDSSLSAGGAFCLGDWTYCDWHWDFPEMYHEHINVKELATTLVAAIRWSPLWANHRVVLFTDNKVTEAIINNGTTHNLTCLKILQELASLALHFDFSITAVYIPGSKNTIADTISRLSEPQMWDKLSGILKTSHSKYFLPNHMSRNAFLSLPYQVQYQPP